MGGKTSRSKNSILCHVMSLHRWARNRLNPSIVYQVPPPQNERVWNEWNALAQEVGQDLTQRSGDGGVVYCPRRSNDIVAVRGLPNCLNVAGENESRQNLCHYLESRVFVGSPDECAAEGNRAKYLIDEAARQQLDSLDVEDEFPSKQPAGFKIGFSDKPEEYIFALKNSGRDNDREYVDYLGTLDLKASKEPSCNPRDSRERQLAALAIGGAASYSYPACAQQQLQQQQRQSLPESAKSPASSEWQELQQLQEINDVLWTQSIETAVQARQAELERSEYQSLAERLGELARRARSPISAARPAEAEPGLLPPTSSFSLQQVGEMQQQQRQEEGEYPPQLQAVSPELSYRPSSPSPMITTFTGAMSPLLLEPKGTEPLQLTYVPQLGYTAPASPESKHFPSLEEEQIPPGGFLTLPAPSKETKFPLGVVPTSPIPSRRRQVKPQALSPEALELERYSARYPYGQVLSRMRQTAREEQERQMRRERIEQRRRPQLTGQNPFQ